VKVVTVKSLIQRDEASPACGQGHLQRGLSQTCISDSCVGKLEQRHKPTEVIKPIVAYRSDKTYSLSMTMKQPRFCNQGLGQGCACSNWVCENKY